MRYQAALRPDSKYSNRMEAMPLTRGNIFAIYPVRSPQCPTHPVLCPGWSMAIRFLQPSVLGRQRLKRQGCSLLAVIWKLPPWSAHIATASFPGLVRDNRFFGGAQILAWS